jgi:hypothetical protein
MVRLKPLIRQSQPLEMPVQPGRIGDRSFFSPWTNWHGWIVMLAGVVVGHVIGFSPQLFVLIGVLCLACGWFRDP